MCRAGWAWPRGDESAEVGGGQLDRLVGCRQSQQQQQRRRRQLKTDERRREAVELIIGIIVITITPASSVRESPKSLIIIFESSSML